MLCGIFLSSYFHFRSGGTFLNTAENSENPEMSFGKDFFERFDIYIFLTNSERKLYVDMV